MGPKQPIQPVTGDPEPFPLLSHWSDVVFLQWKYLHENLDGWHDMQGLKAVFRDAIENGATKEIIEMALKDKAEQLKAWPGTVR